MTGSRSNRSVSDIRFFGEITASLSHELKNALAIINENAGLLEDFSFMAADGNPIDPKRLGTVAGKIRRQVRRADEMIKRLNQIGYSVKRPLDDVNLAGCIETVCALAARKAALKEVALTIVSPTAPVTVKTYPFCLQQLIWLCIDQAIAVAGASDAIEIKIKSTKESAAIILSLMEDTANKPVDIGPETPPRNLLGLLNAALVPDRNKGILMIELPFEISV